MSSLYILNDSKLYGPEKEIKQYADYLYGREVKLTENMINKQNKKGLDMLSPVLNQVTLHSNTPLDKLAGAKILAASRKKFLNSWNNIPSTLINYVTLMPKAETYKQTIQKFIRAIDDLFHLKNPFRFHTDKTKTLKESVPNLDNVGKIKPPKV